MGLRDALKAKLKAALGRTPPSAAAASAAAPTASAPTASAASASAASAPAASAPAPNSAPAEAAYNKVAPASAVREGKPGIYVHAGLNVAVFRHAGALYAMDNACAHEDGPIGEGAIEGKCVRCPYHDWQYDFTTGACITDPERPRATFAVREADGSIWLGPQLTAGSMSRGGDHDDGMEVIRK